MENNRNFTFLLGSNDNDNEEKKIHWIKQTNIFSSLQNLRSLLLESFDKNFLKSFLNHFHQLFRQ